MQLAKLHNMDNSNNNIDRLNELLFRLVTTVNHLIAIVIHTKTSLKNLLAYI